MANTFELLERNTVPHFLCVGPGADDPAGIP